VPGQSCSVGGALMLAQPRPSGLNRLAVAATSSYVAENGPSSPALVHGFSTATTVTAHHRTPGHNREK
jgi:hypothetical protein